VTFSYEIDRLANSEVDVRLATATVRLVALGADSRPRKLPDDLLRALAAD
jgi:acyl-CoA thioesterase FadM